MELPYEVLVYIFNYLPKSDRLAASETCQSWYLAANDHHFLKNKLGVFYKTVFNEEDSCPLQIFINSSVNCYNFLFSEVEISNKTNDFWDQIGENILSLTLTNCDICEKEFIFILEKTPYLQELNIHSCRELFMSGRLLEGKTDGLLSNSLDKLLVLSLSGNQYLTDALFNRFVNAAPALEELNLSGCSLQFHFGLVKKFYLISVDTNSKPPPSESVLTFYFVLNFIKSAAKSIKRLFFSKTLIDGAALKSLAEVEDLKLDYLDVNSCEQLTNDGILALSTHQTTLRKLDIGMCSRVTDVSLLHICNNLFNLESLNIQRSRAVTDLGIVLLKNLKKIRELNISQCDNITKSGLENGICSEVNETLEVLDMCSLNLDQSGIIMLSEKLPNLRNWDVSYCFNGVTDTSIQVIFKNQVLLHTLKLSHCDKVSDAGLTGMGKLEAEGDDGGPIMSDYDEDLAHPRIHLGSRAEEEIVRDARRKRDVMKMCEQVSSDNYSGYSLARIKSLRELDISGCNRITDVSLTYAFKFKELSVLNMSRCQQITHEGVERLVAGCPSIELFNLVDCYNLKDDAVVEIVKGLRRLKQLELRGCNQLTDVTLQAVQSYCEKLRFLDVQGCRNMSPELACSIGTLPTLHTVLMSKPGPYVTEGLKNRSPAPAFLPALMKKLLSRRDGP